MTFVYFILFIGPLIFVHELGHFLFAKLFDVKVLKFSLGFGPRAVGFHKGETEYVVAWFPLGGYVKMLGEDPNDEVRPEDYGRAFNQKPLWQRYIVVLAGPAFNLSRCLRRVQDGEYNTVARLRKGDNLHDIADAFNQMVEVLQERAREDVRVLRRLAHGSGKMTSDPVAQAVAEELSSLIARKERSLGILSDQEQTASGS